MTNTIKHQGIVENIEGTHLQVRIVQTSACASCSIKGHCTSTDTKEKLIDVTDAHAACCRPGDRVRVVGALSMGVQAVVWAFIVPFVLVVAAVFVLMSVLAHELWASLGALALLIPYYIGLWLCRERMRRKFSFWIERDN